MTSGVAMSSDLKTSSETRQFKVGSGSFRQVNKPQSIYNTHKQKHKYQYTINCACTSI